MTKGVVFTLDAIVAAGIVIILIGTAYSLSDNVYQGGIEVISITRTASDIVAVMDYNGAIETLDSVNIENTLTGILPANMDMSMVIYVYNENLELIDAMQINTDIQDNFYMGKWSTMKFDSNGVENFIYIDYKAGYK